MSNQTPLQYSDDLKSARLAQETPGQPLDPDSAVAAILSRLATGEFLVTADSFAALRASNLALLGSSPAGIRNALARQATLLEALFLSLSARSLQARSGSEAQSRLTHAAVGCQQACMRTLVALGATAPTPEG